MAKFFLSRLDAVEETPGGMIADARPAEEYNTLMDFVEKWAMRELKARLGKVVEDDWEPMFGSFGGDSQGAF